MGPVGPGGWYEASGSPAAFSTPGCDAMSDCRNCSSVDKSASEPSAVRTGSWSRPTSAYTSRRVFLIASSDGASWLASTRSCDVRRAARASATRPPSARGAMAAARLELIEDPMRGTPGGLGSLAGAPPGAVSGGSGSGGKSSGKFPSAARCCSAVWSASSRCASRRSASAAAKMAAGVSWAFSRRTSSCAGARAAAVTRGDAAGVYALLEGLATSGSTGSSIGILSGLRLRTQCRETRFEGRSGRPSLARPKQKFLDRVGFIGTDFVYEKLEISPRPFKGGEDGLRLKMCVSNDPFDGRTMGMTSVPV